MADDPDRDSIPDDELVHEDDAVIGRAFRRSLVVIAVVAILVLVGFFVTRQAPREEQVLAKQVGEIHGAEAATAAMPGVLFKDVTTSSGVTFVHTNGARGDKLLPETMGGGVAFFDYDDDGDQDLYFVNSASWAGDVAPERPTQALYRNDGRGSFDDVTAEAGLDQTFFGMGVATADYDGDGDVDLFVTTIGANRLYRNDDGRFVEVTAAAGVAGDTDRWSSSAGFFDFDNDGDLDLMVCNYVEWSKEIDAELDFSLNGRDRAYGPPTHYGGTHSYLYRNDGDGTFSNVSAAAGIEVENPQTGLPMGKALALTFVDIEGDGRQDVFVANDTVQNFLFHNLGNGRFEEVGATAGVGFGSAGNATGAMGIDVAHYRNDVELGVGIANFANEMTSLYVAQRRSLMFTDEAIGEGIGAPSRSYLSFGLFFFDYDLDGRLDLLQANGHLENEIHEVQASQTYRQPAQLFWNAGPDQRSCFAEVSSDDVGDLSRPIVGRGAAYADMDGDGDLDLVVTQTGGAPLLLRNDQQLGHRWLRVRLDDSGGNRDAIGAWVVVEHAGQVQRRQIMPTRSYLSQVELPVTFGLGADGAVDGIRVIWPDGAEQDVEIEGLERLITVRRESG